MISYEHGIINWLHEGCFKYSAQDYHSMPTQSQNLLREIEDIKTRLISIETRILKTEKASKEDKKAIREALKDYKKGKTTRL